MNKKIAPTIFILDLIQKNFRQPNKYGSLKTQREDIDKVKSIINQFLENIDSLDFFRKEKDVKEEISDENRKGELSQTRKSRHMWDIQQILRNKDYPQIQIKIIYSVAKTLLENTNLFKNLTMLKAGSILKELDDICSASEQMFYFSAKRNPAKEHALKFALNYFQPKTTDLRTLNSLINFDSSDPFKPIMLKRSLAYCKSNTISLNEIGFNTSEKIIKLCTWLSKMSASDESKPEIYLNLNNCDFVTEKNLDIVFTLLPQIGTLSISGCGPKISNHIAKSIKKEKVKIKQLIAGGRELTTGYAAYVTDLYIQPEDEEASKLFKETSFPKLQRLKIDMDKLRSLNLTGCSVLKSLELNGDDRLNHVTGLSDTIESIWIACCDIDHFNLPAQLKSLEMVGMHQMTELPKLPDHLKEIKIRLCPDLEKVADIFPSKLETFFCGWCDNLKEIPKNFPKSLKSINLKCNTQLMKPNEEILPENCKLEWQSE